MEAGQKDPGDVLDHQYELERELRERTAKELAAHDRQLSELYRDRNDHTVRIDRLEQSVKSRRAMLWFTLFGLGLMIVHVCWAVIKDIGHWLLERL